MAALASTKKIRRVYHFERGGNADFNFTEAVTNGTISYTSLGAQILLDDNTGVGRLDWGDSLKIDIDQLIAVEFLVRLVSWTEDVIAFFGVGGAATGSNVASWAIKTAFKVGGGAVSGGPYPVSVISDDGTHDTTVSTGHSMDQNTWKRLRLGFKENVQSISPPGVSLPGKSSVQYRMTDINGASAVAKLPTAHLDMSSYAGLLQPVIATIQPAGAGTNAVTACREVCIEYEDVI